VAEGAGEDGAVGDGDGGNIQGWQVSSVSVDVEGGALPLVDRHGGTLHDGGAGEAAPISRGELEPIWVGGVRRFEPVRIRAFIERGYRKGKCVNGLYTRKGKM